MTPEEFSDIRTKLKMSRAQLAIALGDGSSVYSVRTIGAWEDGTNAVPPAVSKLMRLILKARTPQHCNECDTDGGHAPSCVFHGKR